MICHSDTYAFEIVGVSSPIVVTDDVKDRVTSMIKEISYSYLPHRKYTVGHTIRDLYVSTCFNSHKYESYSNLRSSPIVLFYIKYTEFNSNFRNKWTILNFLVDFWFIKGLGFVRSLKYPVSSLFHSRSNTRPSRTSKRVDFHDLWKTNKVKRRERNSNNHVRVLSRKVSTKTFETSLVHSFSIRSFFHFLPLFLPPSSPSLLYVDGKD